MVKLDRFEIIAILVGVAVYVLVALSPIKAKQYGDRNFHRETKRINEWVWGDRTLDRIPITKAPGPILFYIPPYIAAGKSPSDTTLWYWAVGWTAIFMVISPLFLYRACRILGYDRAGKFAVWLCFLIPLHLYYSLGISAEPLAFFGACMMVYGFCAALSGPMRRSCWVLFGFGFLCVVEARPNAILGLPVLAALSLIYFNRVPDSKTLIKPMLLTCAVLVAVVGVIAVGVKALPGNRAVSDQSDYLAFVATLGRYQFRTEPFDWRFWDVDYRPDSQDYQAWAAKRKEIKQTELTNASFVVQDVLENPGIAVKQFFVRIVFGNTLQISSIPKEQFGLGRIRGEWFFWLVHIGLNVIQYAIVLGATAFCFLKGLDRRLIVLHGVWIGLMVFNGIIYMEQRYLFPARPVLIVLFAIWLESCVFRKSLNNPASSEDNHVPA